MYKSTYAQMKILETKNCILRPVLIEDANDMFEYYSKPEVVKFLPIKKHKTINDTKRFIRLFFLQNYNSGRIGHYAVVYKEDNKVIGNIGFNNIQLSSSEGEIGICINPSYWGKNLSTELCIKILEFGFVELKLDKIIAIIYEDNKYSKKPIEKLGFTYTGNLKKTTKLKSYKDIVCYKYEMNRDYYFQTLAKILNMNNKKHKKRNGRFGKSK